MKNITAQQVAAFFGVPETNVKAQYAKNAHQLRGMAKQAGAGKYRGKTSAQWNALAQMAEEKSQ
jgi:hypothetical protein